MPAAASHTSLVTMLGAFARRAGEWLPVGGIVGLLDALGVDESSARTSVSRLKKRGWLAAEKRDGRSGYRLTPLAKQAFAAGDRVIWHARRPAELDDGWCIASFSIPEQDRAKRHLLRSRLADAWGL
jgi:phenylacetic acid degradation operon negative regulatory protein